MQADAGQHKVCSWQQPHFVCILSLHSFSQTPSNVCVHCGIGCCCLKPVQSLLVTTAPNRRHLLSKLGESVPQLFASFFGALITGLDLQKARGTPGRSENWRQNFNQDQTLSLETQPNLWGCSMDMALVEVCTRMNSVVVENMQINDTYHSSCHHDQAARSQLAPRGVLRAGINLSNFLLVTGKDEQVIIIMMPTMIRTLMMTTMMMIVKILIWCIVLNVLGPAIWLNCFANFEYISVSTIDLLGPGQPSSS